MGEKLVSEKAKAMRNLKVGRVLENGMIGNVQTREKHERFV
jgi:hypothetical protein